MSKFLTPRPNQYNRVVMFLQTHSGFWCNACIGASVGRAGPIVEVTRRLSKNRRYFEQVDRVNCCGCDTLGKCVRFMA